jgi:broad specificity phosphatase PhoE
MGLRALVLLRHGESLGNVAAAEAHEAGVEEIDVSARDPDVELSELGRWQAEAVGPALNGLADDKRPEVVACSPYARATQTARLACEAAGLSLPVGWDERLRDRELGVLDRLTERGVVTRHPEEDARRGWQGKFYHRPAGGESWADVVHRLRTWLADADRIFDGKCVLLVSHDVVILLLRYVCEGLDEEQVLHLGRVTPMHNAALSRFDRDDQGQWTVSMYDDVTHLDQAGLPVTAHRGARDGGT